MGGTLAYGYDGQYPDDVERLRLVDTGPGPKPTDVGASAAGPRAGGAPALPSGPFEAAVRTRLGSKD